MVCRFIGSYLMSSVAPETVLVIKGSQLLTRDAWLEEGDRVEVRPVMSGGR